MKFRDRDAAGQDLARELVLAGYGGEDVVVYGVPRGGVVVAAAAARLLGSPLDLVIARKIGHPLAPEFAIGAVTADGEPVWDTSELGFTDQKWRDRQVELARREARRREARYRFRPAILPAGRTAIIVDDGIATGLTIMAAVKELRQQHPKLIVVAAPVGSQDVIERLAADSIDDLVIAYVPAGFFGAVGQYYDDFSEVTDEEVRQLMQDYRPGTDPLDLEGLNSVLATVGSFPVTSTQLAREARRLKAPYNVTAFFETIPGEVKFESKADIIRRSSAAEILMEEEVGQPEEWLRSYDDTL